MCKECPSMEAIKGYISRDLPLIRADLIRRGLLEGEGEHADAINNNANIANIKK